VRLLLIAFSALALVGQAPVSPRSRVFVHHDATVTLIPSSRIGIDQYIGDRLEPFLHVDSGVDADTAIVDIFYQYDWLSDLTNGDGKPVKLLLSVRVTCPVMSPMDSGCDFAARYGLTLDSVQFVRVKFMKTVRELDHVGPLPER
jgi:hypothetical protein